MTGSSIWRSWGEMWRRNINAEKQGKQTWLISHAGRDTFGNFWRFFLRFFWLKAKVCLVDRGNVKNDELGISIHNSPDLGSVRLKWKRFVSIHQKDFNPVGKFAVCSEHFTRDCFTLAFPMKDVKRNLKKGTFPTIWKKSSQTPSKRSRRSVSEITMYLRCAYHHYIYFPIYLWHDFFWHRCSIFV